jgi:hypothetical protein
MMMYGEVKVQLHSLLTSVLDGGGECGSIVVKALYYKTEGRGF